MEKVLSLDRSDIYNLLLEIKAELRPQRDHHSRWLLLFVCWCWSERAQCESGFAFHMWT